ncbi:MAG: transcriptional regulator [Clostridiales bacterium]|nr:transcriptional regulator [Clostridiales bacterium]
MTLEQFALLSGLGLHFVSEPKQGKETVHMDKVNVAIAMFNTQAVAGKKENK